MNNTTTIPRPTGLPESDIIKDIESCTVYQMILRLLRFQLLIVMILDSLVSMFIRIETLDLG